MEKVIIEGETRLVQMKEDEETMMMVHGCLSDRNAMSKSTSTTTTTTTTTTSTSSTCIDWKLYDNPFYDSRNKCKRHHKLGKTTACSMEKLSAFSGSCPEVEMERKDQLNTARTQVLELRAELEYQRKVRKKVETWNRRLEKELAEDRKAREALERVCEDLGKEIKSCRTEINKMKNEIEEERKMLRLAEVFREERVRMKLVDSKTLLEQKLGMEAKKQTRELEPEANSATKNNRDGNSNGAMDLSGKLSELNLGKRFCEDKNDHDNNNSSKNARGGPKVTMVLREKPQSCSENVLSSIVSSKPKASPEPENPHITRGIKGFVEYPRVVRAMGAKNRHSSSGLDRCQTNQLRNLLKQKCPIRSNFNLISS